MTEADPRAEPRAAGVPAPALSVVIPAYDEEAAIGEEIDRVHAALGGSGVDYEVIVVDDGSRDRTFEIASSRRCRVLRHKSNRGYGAALKHGIAAARGAHVAILDADGTYPAESLLDLWAERDDYDMVVGARLGKQARIPWVRRPAKWALGRLASYLVERDIPDLNSGFRLLRRSQVEQFAHILPNGFSFTTTITLALMSCGYSVGYLPIRYAERVGASKIRPAHAYEFLLLILRLVVLFNPLRVFLPLGALAFAAGAVKLGYDIVKDNLSESAVMALLAALILWGFGLLADQNARFNLDRSGWNR